MPSQQSDELVNMDAYLKSPAFQNSSIQRLSGAVQIDTQSFDDLGKVGEDKRWEVFFPFHEYLEKVRPMFEDINEILANFVRLSLWFTSISRLRKSTPTVLFILGKVQMLA